MAGGFVPGGCDIAIADWQKRRREGAAIRSGIDWRRTAYVVLLAALLINVITNALWVESAFGGLKDLDSFLHSGAAYARGLNPYHYYWWLRPEPISPEALNLNPPISVYLFEPLLGVNRGLLGTLFLLGSIGLVATSVAMLMAAYPDKRSWMFVLIVAGMAGIWQMLWYLQIYAPLLLAMTGAWLLLRRGGRTDVMWAGVLIGLVIAVKPNYALIPVVLLLARHYRPALAACFTAALISLIPLLIDGPGIYTQWLHMTRVFDGYEWTSNSSLVSVGARVGALPAGQAASALLAAGVLLFARLRKPGLLDATALSLTTVILVGPVSWAGYTLLLLPYLFSLRWDGWTWCAVGLLVIPFAPERAVDALGMHSLGAWHLPVHVALAFIPTSIASLFGAFAVPIAEDIYTWAVLLLLWRLVLRLLPGRTRPASGSLAALPPASSAPLPAPAAEASVTQGVVTAASKG